MKENDIALLTCPHCGQVQEVAIPQNGCLAFHECEHCRRIISVPEGSKHCCVICAYSDKKCPVAGRAAGEGQQNS